MAAALGHIVVIRRSGADGGKFPLEAGKQVVFGRSMACDIRIQLAEVSNEHLLLDYDENSKLFIRPLSEVNQSLLNKKQLQQDTVLHSGDVFSIGGRNFRFEVC